MRHIINTETVIRGFQELIRRAINAETVIPEKAKNRPDNKQFTLLGFPDSGRGHSFENKQFTLLGFRDSGKGENWPENKQCTLLGFPDSRKCRKQARNKIVYTSRFEQKKLLLKSMGKLFPHPVGVFRTIPNRPKSRIMHKIDFWPYLVIFPIIHIIPIDGW